MSEFKKDIIKEIQSMSGAHSVYEIFDDWVKMCALAISNAVDVLPSHQKSRDDLYVATTNKYNESEIKRFGDLLGMLTLEAEEGFSDILGYVYMHLEISSSRLGQFFTPYHICQLMAKMQKAVDETCYMNEPSCGAGGNIIAMAEHFHNSGIDYQKRMRVVCQDLDWKAVYMCYVQLSLYGINAKVIQGDTLLVPEQETRDRNTFYTPEFVRAGWWR